MIFLERVKLKVPSSAKNAEGILIYPNVPKSENVFCLLPYIYSYSSAKDGLAKIYRKKKELEHEF
jgi:hypothetical protein